MYGAVLDPPPRRFIARNCLTFLDRFIYLSVLARFSTDFADSSLLRRLRAAVKFYTPAKRRDSDSFGAISALLRCDTDGALSMRSRSRHDMARLKDRPAENPATAPEIRFIAAIRLQRKAKQVPMRKLQSLKEKIS